MADQGEYPVCDVAEKGGTAALARGKSQCSSIVDSAQRSTRTEGADDGNEALLRPARECFRLCLGSRGRRPGNFHRHTPGHKLEEVVVTGFRQSIEVALDAKRDSVNFTDSISAEDVGKLPDNNLAEALQRVPGVQISRTNGEGQQISLRGMGSSFARVLLDGMPISAASEGSVDQQARNREFDFDLLPSEIFSMLQVSKTRGASMVEGGLSGTVDSRTPRFGPTISEASYRLQGVYQTSSEESRSARQFPGQQELGWQVRRAGERCRCPANLPHRRLELAGLDLRPHVRQPAAAGLFTVASNGNLRERDRKHRQSTAGFRQRVWASTNAQLGQRR